MTIDQEQVDVLATFAAFPATLADVMRGVAGMPIPAGAGAGEWGPAEIARHLIAVERAVWQVRLDEVATQDDPQWGWTEPGQAPGFDASSVGDILVAFAEVRAETVAVIRDFDDAEWARSGTHATYGVLDVAGLLRIAIDHDAEHLRGIARPA